MYCDVSTYTVLCRLYIQLKKSHKRLLFLKSHIGYSYATQVFWQNWAIDLGVTCPLDMRDDFQQAIHSEGHVKIR